MTVETYGRQIHHLTGVLATRTKQLTPHSLSANIMEMESIVRWLRRSQHRIQRNGLRGAIGATKPVYIKALQQMLPDGGGEAIFARDWDLLIVLDACRFDLLSELASVNEYSFLTDISTFRSLDSTTKAWMAQNFTADHRTEIQHTAYVCDNPFSAEELNAAEFALLDEVWKYGWDNELGTLPPRTITDRAIAAGRSGNSNRIIAHYMQPHNPFVRGTNPRQRKSTAEWGEESTPDIWRQLEDRNVEPEQVWEDYRATLDYVLEEVELLLDNIDAERAVISSDHGNAIGEWGLYGHPPNLLFECLRTVPWIRTTASDSNTHTPTTERKQQTTDNETQVAEQLDALGYR